MNARLQLDLRSSRNYSPWHYSFFSVMLALSHLWLVPATTVWAQEKDSAGSQPPELRLSLKEAMQAAVNENPSVQIFKERITQAQDQADTQLGALLPNISATIADSGMIL